MKEKKQKVTNHTIKNKPKDFLIPIITSLVFIALIFTPVYINFNSLFYDLFLTTKNKIKEEPRIVLLNVDDKAIDKLGATTHEPYGRCLDCPQRTTWMDRYIEYIHRVLLVK